MLDDWFELLEFPLPLEEFERLPRHPSYKYEYFGGRAVLTPRPNHAHAVLDLSIAASAVAPSATGPASPNALPRVRRLRTGDWAALPRLFAAAFHDHPPFSALAGDRLREAAQDCLAHTRTGGDGALIEDACLVSHHDSDPDRLTGAILVTLVSGAPAAVWAEERQQVARGVEGEDRSFAVPHLTWVFVDPWQTHRGVGSTLLAAAADALRRLGHTEMASTFDVGNARAVLWHWRNGFRLLRHWASMRGGSEGR